MNISVKWDAEIWVKWAIENNIDSRCINFILLNPDIVTDENPVINSRSITLFFNAISSIEDFNSDEGLRIINLLGETSLGIEFASMFTTFIHNKLDKIPSIKDIMNTKISFNVIEEELKYLLKSDENYRSDIAYVIVTKLINHCKIEYKNIEPDEEVVNRLKDLILSPVIGSDLKFVIGKNIGGLSEIGRGFKSLLSNSKIIDIILT